MKDKTSCREYLSSYAVVIFLPEKPTRQNTLDQINLIGTLLKLFKKNQKNIRKNRKNLFLVKDALNELKTRINESFK